MNIDERCLAGNAGVTIRHRHYRSLLQTQHVVNIRKVHQRIDESRFVRPGIAEDILDVPKLQGFAGDAPAGDIVKNELALGLGDCRKNIGQLACRHRADAKLCQRVQKLPPG